LLTPPAGSYLKLAKSSALSPSLILEISKVSPNEATPPPLLLSSPVLLELTFNFLLPALNLTNFLTTGTLISILSVNSLFITVAALLRVGSGTTFTFSIKNLRIHSSVLIVAQSKVLV
jgi:hypothetical protein